VKRLPREAVCLGLLAALLGLAGCGGQPAPALTGDADTLGASPPLPTLLKTHVVTLSDTIGNRSVNAYTHLTQAANYIEDAFGAQGYTVTRQTFTAGGKSVRNVIANKRGRNPSLPIVLIGAHYDSYYAPGADDNASGVAAMLGLARRLSGKTTPGSVRFVAFVNEEDPWWGTNKMGSLVCARAARAAGENLRVMLNLDMVGYYPGGRHYLLVGSNVRSSATGERVKRLLGQSTTFALRSMDRSDPAIRWSDHWAFWQEGYQALYLAGPSWDHDQNIHSPADTWEKLSYANMAELVRGLDTVVFGLWQGQPAAAHELALWPGTLVGVN